MSGEIGLGCNMCWRIIPTKNCACGFTRYCSVDCQKKHWPKHKLELDHNLLKSKKANLDLKLSLECRSHFKFLLKSALYDTKKCNSHSALRFYAQNVGLLKEEYFLRYEIYQRNMTNKQIKDIWRRFILGLVLHCPSSQDPTFQWVAPGKAIIFYLSPKTPECDKHGGPVHPNATANLWVKMSFASIDFEAWSRIELRSGDIDPKDILLNS